MKSDIFLPKKIKVGFQERKDTYTGKLSFITYYDAKGVLRKEKSWDGWRDKKINAEEFENVPTEGFVLNKKAGGYDTGWNHRQTYVRVYDPRGFELEISVANLLYILENTSSIKGKGLEGEFVYGWSGAELILIPTSSPDYKEIKEYSELLKNKTHVKAKELILGATYKTKKNEEFIYLGRFESFCPYNGTEEGKKYFFKTTNQKYYQYEKLKSLGDKIILCTNEMPVENYASLVDELEGDKNFSPYDSSKDVYHDYTLEEFAEEIKNGRGYYFSKKYRNIIVSPDYHNVKAELYNVEEIKDGRSFYGSKILMERKMAKEIFEKIQPQYKTVYLKNGRILSEKTGPNSF